MIIVSSSGAKDKLTDPTDFALKGSVSMRSLQVFPNAKSTTDRHPYWACDTGEQHKGNMDNHAS